MGKAWGQVQRGSSLGMALAGMLLVLCPGARALNPSLEISQYAHTAWKTRDGFSRGAITSIAQTPDGYLWLGTEFGLLRFDGVRAVPWEPPAGAHLSDTNVEGLLAARDGTLWIGTRHGLASWNGSKLMEYPQLAGEGVYALLEDHEGTIWVGRNGSAAEVCSIRGAAVQCDGENGALGPSVLALYEDRGGNLWVAAESGLWRWRPGAAKLYQATGLGQTILNLLEGDNGALLLAKQEWMARLVDGRMEKAGLPGGGPANPYRLLRDRDGGLWIGTRGQGLAHVHDGKLDVFGRSNGLSGDFVISLFEDREGNIWVATLDGGLDRFRDFAVSTISTSQGLSNANVWSVLGTPDGSVWLGTTTGLNRWKDGQIAIYRRPGAVALSGAQRAAGVRQITDSGLPEDSADSLFEDDAGRIWVSTSSGVGYFQDDRFVRVEGVPAGAVLSFAGDRNDDLWISNRTAGLLHLIRGSVVERIAWSALGARDAAYTLLADPVQGGVWIGFFEDGVAYYKDGQVRATYKPADGLGQGFVKDLHIDRDGAVWAATQGGLSRIKGGRVNTLTSRNGLPCDTVHWMVEDNAHSVWMLTACGLVRTARSELDAWAADPKRTIAFTVFDSSDGVLSHPTTSGFSPRVAKSADGRIWFLPFDGASFLDPRHIPFNSIPPPVYVERVVADRTTYTVDDEASERMRLPPLIRDLEIDYTALSLVAAEKVLFRIKLEGFDRSWHDVGNRRQAFYTSLPPGNYRFRVAACNNSGVWNETGAVFDFSILPAFYQTMWFRFICGAAFLLSLWGLYQLRLRQLQQQFAIGLEARVNERTRIARELHDTLLQSLHGVLFQFQAARNLLPRSPDEAMAALDGAILETEQAIAESRDAIHDLRAEPGAQADLAELLTVMGQELAESRKTKGQSPELRLVAEGERRTLSDSIQDEVYRIAVEILRNAFQHARADRIEVEIRYDDQEFRLRIRDDGIGIDPKVLEQGGRSGHWGLRGIHERAQKIGAGLDFWSEAGAGTEVQLTIPAALAYDQVANVDLRKPNGRESFLGGKTT